jgi:hypothetical protein
MVEDMIDEVDIFSRFPMEIIVMIIMVTPSLEGLKALWDTSHFFRVTVRNNFTRWIRERGLSDRKPELGLSKVSDSPKAIILVAKVADQLVSEGITMRVTIHCDKHEWCFVQEDEVDSVTVEDLTKVSDEVETRARLLRRERPAYLVVVGSDKCHWDEMNVLITLLEGVRIRSLDSLLVRMENRMGVHPCVRSSGGGMKEPQNCLLDSISKRKIRFALPQECVCLRCHGRWWLGKTRAYSDKDMVTDKRLECRRNSSVVSHWWNR